MAKMKQIVAVVNRKQGDKGFWTRIGVAFENDDGSLTLKFDYLPTNPKTTIQVREMRRAQDEAQAPAEAGQ